MLRPASRPTCSTLPIAALQSDSPSLDLAKLFKTQFLNPERFQQLLLIKLVPKKFNRGGSPSKDTSAGGISFNIVTKNFDLQITHKLNITFPIAA